MDILSSFFANLTARFGKENDLSDITWAMCQTSPCFKEIWINFFFEGKINISDVEYIEREVPDSNNSGSRVDFKLTLKTDSLPYLIEVKIWDQDHHFGKYEEAYGENGISLDKSRLGYITNYYLKQDGYDVRQWREFYETLQRKIASNVIPDEEQELIIGYSEYLKNVCGINMITEKIDLTKLNSLFDLTIVLRELSEYSNGTIDVKNYNTTHRDDLRWLFLEVDYKQINGWGRQFPFLGIIFGNQEAPYICAGFDYRKGWSRDIVDYMRNNSTLFSRIKREYCTAPRLDKDIVFYLSDFAKTKFAEASGLAEQKEILKCFIDEVLMFPVNLLKLK